MIFYRAMSTRELSLFEHHKTIYPTNRSVTCSNSWNTAMVTFFGTANNALHWARKDRHDVIAAFRINPKLVKAGWGVYPDWAAEIDVLELLNGIVTGNYVERNLLKVREYGVPFYNDQEAYLLNCMVIDRENKYESNFPLHSVGFGGVKLEGKDNYDDIIERVERKQ